MTRSHRTSGPRLKAPSVRSWFRGPGGPRFYPLRAGLRGGYHRLLTVALVLLLGGATAYAGEPVEKTATSTPFATIQERLSHAADAVLEKAGQAEPRTTAGEPRHSSSPAGMPEAGPPTLRPAAPARVEELRPLVEPILRREGVPPEFIAVLRVESAGNPLALSPKGARGLWQFMPETARRYGLRVDAERDDRLDPVLSTRAAARYLRDLYQRFGDWALALAAYNAGAVQVERAVRRGGAPDFWRLSAQGLLPPETRAYVAAVLRLAPQSGPAEVKAPEFPLGRPRPPGVVYALPQPTSGSGMTPVPLL